MAGIDSTIAPPTTKDSATKAKALFFTAAGISFGLSVFLYFYGDKQNGMFVGLWVPSILSAGALLMGRDRHE
ncbi:MAG: hypothetical protein KDD43_10750 [Bdellovibrionales bacterium]|nr:hypothetical protein [Bdellovibrionales bacterium]